MTNPLSLPFTGERVVPDKMQNRPDILTEHLARYRFAAAFCGTGQVLDAPCGTGYGVNLISQLANPSPAGFSGVDISPDAIAYAQAAYPNHSYWVQDLSDPTSIPNRNWETVISFEGLEHIDDPKPFISWVKDNAVRFIFSIPVSMPSEFHRQVYTVREIQDLFSGFKSVAWYGQTGENIVPLSDNPNPVYVVGIAECTP